MNKLNRKETDDRINFYSNIHIHFPVIYPPPSMTSINIEVSVLPFSDCEYHYMI